MSEDRTFPKGERTAAMKWPAKAAVAPYGIGPRGDWRNSSLVRRETQPYGVWRIHSLGSPHRKGFQAHALPDPWTAGGGGPRLWSTAA